MTLEEKLSLMQGAPELPYAGSLPAITRLGIPAHTLEDGPQGVGDGLQHVTAWPSALAAASSWDTELMRTLGAAMGNEQFLKGTNVMLGPGVCLARVPLNGRLYEYYAEDPVVASAMVAAVVQGVQSNNVTACVKHFIGNSQEWQRGAEDAIVTERALHELFLPGYRAAVNAGAGSFMLGVNKVRGIENSANAETIGFLFSEGFEGWMVTDWAGIVIPNASAAVWAGTSVEMPRGYQYQFIPAFIANGSIPVSLIDSLVTRILTASAATGVLDTPASPDRNVNAVVTSPEHIALARTIGARAAVLLKNDIPQGDTVPLLPLVASRMPRGILVLGDNDTVIGCGSGEVRVPYTIPPIDALYAALNSGSQRPINCTFLPHTDFFQDGAVCHTVAGDALNDACCALCTATPTCNTWTVVPNSACPAEPRAQPAGQCFLKPNEAGLRPHPGITSGICAPLPPSAVPLVAYGGTDATAAAALAATVDVVLFVAATPAQEPQPGCEGVDRLTLALPSWQDAMIAAIAAANPRTIVVTRTGGAVLMPWSSSVPAIVHTGLTGQESGNALADVLVGAENPAGRLTISFPHTDADTWLTTPQQYPGILNSTTGFWETNYSEGLFIGYRWYDAHGTRPLFSFGHGRSYSTFTYSALTVSGSVSPDTNATVMCTITNAAGPPGREVVQLYVAGALAGDPIRGLKSFVNTGVLASGASLRVAFTLTPADLQLYDVNATVWQLYPAGVFQVWVGASSVDLRLTSNVTVAH